MDRKIGMSSLGFHGWYGEASWSLTGESRTYKAGQGKFKRLKPNRNFNFTNVGDGAWGAWELAVRVAGVDMNDGAFQGGEMKNFTVALNWYANENVRFMFGFDRILQIKNSPLVTASGGKPDGLNTFMFRNQIAF
jgi:phosphate-selective porin OprO/OprP